MLLVSGFSCSLSLPNRSWTGAQIAGGGGIGLPAPLEREESQCQMANA